MALTEKEKQRKAIELVAEAHATKKPADLAIKQQLSVFDGTLIVVRWHNGVENRDTESSVFIRGDDTQFFWTPADLVRFLHDNQSKFVVATLLRDFLTIGGGALVIAMIITVTICYLALARADERLLDALTHALSVILGFYFGAKATRS